MSPDEGEEIESPMPSEIQQPVKRRGAISAEPITEEDASSYVKKVSFDNVVQWSSFGEVFPPLHHTLVLRLELNLIDTQTDCDP